MSSIHINRESPLKALKEEMAITLGRVQLELQSYLANPDAIVKLEPAISGVNQIRGAFAMLGYNEAVELAQEVVAVLQELLRRRGANREAVQQPLLQALLQLLTCLEWLQYGKQRQTTDLQSMLRQLRAAAQSPPVGDAPPAKPPVEATLLDSLAVRELAAQTRLPLQQALLGILRAKDAAHNCNTIVQLFSRLREAMTAESDYRFWELAESLARALRDERIPPSQEMFRLLRDLDNRVKYLSETGQVFASGAAALAFSQRLNECLTGGDKGEARRRRQDNGQPWLEIAGVEPEDEHAAITPLDDDTLTILAGLLLDLMLFAQDMLEHLPYTAVAEKPTLGQAAATRLHAITNVLGMLELDDMVGQLRPASARLTEPAVAAMTAAELDRLAAILVALESQLRELPVLYKLHAMAGPADSAGGWSPLASLQRQAVKAIVGYTVQEIGRARELAATALENNDKFSFWGSLHNYLHVIANILVMLESGRAAEFIHRLQAHIAAFMEGDEISSRVFDAFAEIMLALEYYLESLDDGGEADATILTLIGVQVNRLDNLVNGLPPSAAVDTMDRFDGAGGDEAGKEISDKPALDAIESAPTPAALEPAFDSALEGPLPSIPWPEIAAAPAIDAIAAATAGIEAAAGRHANSVNEVMYAAAEQPATCPQAPPAGAMPGVAVDAEILAVFLEEAREEAAAIEQHVNGWRSNPSDREALVAIRRAFHTLKGSGRMVGQYPLGDFAACVEALLNQVIESKLNPSSPVINAVAAARQVLLPCLSESGPTAAETAAMLAMQRRIAALSVAAPAPVASEEAPAPLPTAVASDQAAGRSTLTAADQRAPAAPAEPILYATPTPADRDLLDVFHQEATAILDKSELLLERWKEERIDNELLNQVRRWMHTLKGSAQTAGFIGISDLAHAMETLLDALSARCFPPGSAPVAALQRAFDCLQHMLTAVRNGLAVQPAAELSDELRRLVDESITQPPAPLNQPAEAVAGVTANGTGLLPPAPVLLDQEVMEVFYTEAAEILDNSDITLRRWNARKDSMELLNHLRRQMHTLKGSARMAGLTVIGDLAHTLESVLDALSKGALSASAPVVEAVQRALDGLNERVAEMQTSGVLLPGDELIANLKSLFAKPSQEATPPKVAMDWESEHTTEKPTAAPTEDTIRVSTTLLNKLVNGMGESSICRARADQGLATLRVSLSDMDQTVYRLRQQLRRLEIETDKQILFRHQENAREHQNEFDPLELDRFSELQQFSRSLLEIAEDLANIESTLEDQIQEMSNLLDQQAKVNKEIQQGLMRTRMVRISTVEPRLRRVVRQAAQELGKRAEFIMQGSDCEVDRTVLENMVAPLEHMLRNAISHGVEPPEQRLASGKPEAGAVTLAIRQEGAELILSLKDDGAGLNFTAIRAKGEALGLLKPGQTVTQDELIALMLRPGFTTATKVTQISGRGVGMDVLNDAIKTLRGTLLIQTEPGKGTDFIIRLPFSLVVTHALVVKVGQDIYAIPLLSIESVTRMEENDLRDYLVGRNVELKQGAYLYPLHNLGVLFGVNSIKPYAETHDKRPPALLFRNAETSAALQVDAVLGNQEIIIKPLGPQFQSLKGVSGATVLGDGRVILVLDLAALVRNIASRERRQAEAQALDSARQELRSRHIKVMVIDDSITMRKVTGRLLERHGMLVTAAKDGLEAVAKLDEQIPDLVILDIEMPRMDGFELAGHIRNQARLQHIPIIMVTSRGGDKHRERAARLGVNAYLTKPYQEEEMLSAIAKVLGGGNRALPA